jgi:hypothetical protein
MVMSPLLAKLMLDTPMLVGYAATLLLLLQLTRPVYLAFRRRRTGYGTVFNSTTGLPEPLVSVRLTTFGPVGQVVSTAITDKHGRYRLMAKPGEYILSADKNGFTFPSKYLKQESSVYENILPAAHIVVKDYGMITKNIPIDPADGGRSRVFGWGFRLGKSTQYTLAYGSPFMLVLVPYFTHSFVAWALFWAYMIAILHRMFTYKPADPAFGTIMDGGSREPVSQAIVRVFSTKFNKLLETQITGPKGRYAFVVQPGSYYITIQKPGYRSVRINFPAIKKDGFAMAKDITLSRAAVKEEEAPIQPWQT